MVGVLSNLDGQIHEKERLFAEQYLAVFDLKNTTPLFEITKVPDPKAGIDTLIEKLEQKYPLRSQEEILRQEIPKNLRAIKTAQLMYENDWDVYVKCAAYPAKTSTNPQKWVASESGGFQTINFSPDGNVRGSYMVSTTVSDFTIIGISDIDGDGVFATYIATKSTNPHLYNTKG